MKRYINTSSPLERLARWFKIPSFLLVLFVLAGGNLILLTNSANAQSQGIGSGIGVVGPGRNNGNGQIHNRPPVDSGNGGDRNGTGHGDLSAPTRENLQRVLRTRPNQAVFWTGTVNGESVQGRAEVYATRTDRVTLEMALRRGGIHMPGWNQRDAASVRTWELASRIFAQEATGVVHLVQGDQVRRGNVWENIEFPAVRANHLVPRVVRRMASTGRETVIYELNDELRKR